MADRRSIPALTTPSQAPSPALVLGGPLTLAVAFFLAINGLAPHAALLPTVSAAAIAAAAPTAVFALSMHERQHGALTLMDVAGALALIGCAAAMLSNPESIRQTFAVP
jgi:Zn-dependent protease